MIAGLLAAGILGAALGCAQLVPVFEFTAQSGRAAGQGPHDLFPFSLGPARLIELLWPDIYGTHFAGNRFWLSAILSRRLQAEIWIPSLYVGGLTLLLALSALGFRHGPPARSWLSAIVLISLLGSLGDYTGPLFWGRWFPWVAAWAGPLDPHDTTTIRLDGFLRDGDGSVYWTLAQLLPGFRQFRFPSKLLTFTALGLAGLAGLGWDRLVSTDDPTQARACRARVLSSLFLLLSLAGLIVSVVEREVFLAMIRRKGSHLQSGFGPLDIEGSYRVLRGAFTQGVVVFGVGMLLTWRGARWPGLSGILVLLVMSFDLGCANARHVITVPQALFETEPKVIKLLAEAERKDPTGGPYRVHRMPLWDPMTWLLNPSPNRVRDFVTWERATIQPKYGINYGVQYTLALGVAELYDYEWFFGGFLRSLEPDAARALGKQPGEKIVVYPRRAFDLWNTRYFILPAYPNGWTDEHRGYASFLPDTVPVYPDFRQFDGPEGQAKQKEWLESEDLQIFRNRAAYPRAWVVHAARFLDPIHGLNRTDRDKPMEEILFSNDLFWQDRTLPVFDSRETAWIELEPERARGAQGLSLRGLFRSWREVRGQTHAVRTPAGRARHRSRNTGPGHPGGRVLSRVATVDRRQARAGLPR